MYQKNVGAYQRSDVMTADPLGLVVLCYNSAISNLKLAKVRHSEKKFEAKAVAINKTLDIISELMASLNLEKGGPVAQNLNALYGYMLHRITHGDASRDLSIWDEVISILEELRDAWATIQNPRKLKQAAAPVSRTGGIKTAQMA